MTFVQFKIRITQKENHVRRMSCTFVYNNQLNANSPILGMMIPQKEARKTMPTALHRDDESSNPGSNTGNSPAQGIARGYPKTGK